MKKALLVIGILVIVVGIIALLYAALNWYCFYNTLDGSNSLYARLKSNMRISLIIGIVLEIVGIICLVVRK